MDVKCLPQLLSTTFLRQGLSQNLELNDWARLAGERAPGILYIFFTSSVKDKCFQV